MSWSNLRRFLAEVNWLADSLQVAEEITGKATYDQTVGFILNEMPDFQALYVCSSKGNGVQYSYLPLDTSLRVPAELHLSNVPGKATSFLCSTKPERLESLELTIAPCPSRVQCDLKLRPKYVNLQLSSTGDPSVLSYSYWTYLQDLGKLTGETRSEKAPRYSSEIMFPELRITEGIIGCVGLGSNDTNNVKYAHQFDYFFTGLDGRACKNE